MTIQDATLTVLGFWMDQPGPEQLAATQLLGDWDVETVEESFPEFMPFSFVRHEGSDPDTHEFVVTDYVRGVVERDYPNHGFMLHFPNGDSSDAIYDFMVVSCDSLSTWVRPSLTITYTDGATIE